MATSVGKRRKHTFHPGDRVIGRESARASFRFRHGTVVERTHNSSEFYVRFDDRPDEPEAVFTWWIEKREELQA